MQKLIYDEDEGVDFGKWQDETSKFLYYNSFLEILSKIILPEKVADYGGGNGLLKTFIPNLITVDKDISKKPDIVADIQTYKGDFDLIILRYVLHYLNDYEVLSLFENIKSYHKGNILIIQFTNEDLKSKYFNSKNEVKYFRTLDQLEALLPKNSEQIYSKIYEVKSEFYKNRLNFDNGINHYETLKAYWI